MVERFERFSLAISEISRCWHRIAAEEMEAYGLKGTHAIYLTSLRRYPEGITAARLGELCGKDKADVSRMTSILEKKELIVREGNSYRALLKLTEKGNAAADHVRQRAAVAVEQAGKGISEENRAVFYRVLESIAANLQLICEKGLP